MNTDAAFVELAEAKKAARASRRAFALEPVSAFVRSMWKAIGLYHDARTDGVSREDAIRGLEEELRAAWPKSVSKFAPACDSCDDTGFIDRVCWERNRCQREVCMRNPERQHPYVEICHCPIGDRKRKRTYTPDDAITAAGRTQKKKSGFTRMGR